LIGFLRGRVLELEGDEAVVIDVAGVGYEVTTPVGTMGKAERDAEGVVTLFVHTHVREDALELFGFASQLDRRAFRTLLGISHVGPRLALAVLGALSVGDLVDAVERGQGGRLTNVPGVGKKTAERIVLELKGKLRGWAVGSATPAPAKPQQTHTSTLLHDALVRMGFRASEAERAVSQIADLERPMGELVREALAILAP
jgi:Holliday junction DNA helicase RuvA